MKKLIISCMSLAGLIFLSGCETVEENDHHHRSHGTTTTTTEETTVQRPVSQSSTTETHIIRSN